MKTVLVIDDEPEIRKFIRLVAESCGWRVQECDNGDNIASIVSIDPSITLLILDVNMPGVDGIESISSLEKSRTRGLSIYLMTGGSVKLAEYAKKIGHARGINVQAILQKPFGVQNLTDLLISEHVR